MNKLTFVTICSGLIIASAGCHRKGAGQPASEAPPIQNLTVISNPSGAFVSASSGESCTTPCSLQIVPDKPIALLVQKDGYRAETVRVTTNLERLREFNARKDPARLELIDVKPHEIRFSPNPVDVTLAPERR